MRKRILLITAAAVSLLLCGCSSEKFKLTEQETNDVTYYLGEQKVTSKEPVILLCHGLGGDHTAMQSAAEFFYDAGYAVVTFDLYGNPNETYTSDVCIDEMIEKSKSRIESIVADLEQSQICDTSQLGIYGYSLGGMTAFYTAAYGNVTPKVIMTIAALPDFKYIIENSADQMAAKYSIQKQRYVFTTDVDNQRLLAWAESHNPVDQIDRLANIPILMVNGTDDPYMSIDRAREFQTEIEEKGGFIRVFENPGGTHTDPGDFHVEDMIEIVTDIFSSEK